MINNGIHAETTIVRQATPADQTFLAWCNVAASSPSPDFCYWDALLDGLNTSSLDFAAALFMADALAWGSVADFLLIEEHGKPIAGASGFVVDPSDFRPIRLAKLPIVAQHLGWNEQALEQFRAGYLAVWSDPHDPTIAASAPWTIECVAVIPEARGRGIAKALIQALLDRGKLLGHPAAGIAVTIGNDAAQRVYESVGFEHYMTYGPAYFYGQFPGTIKYCKALI